MSTEEQKIQELELELNELKERCKNNEHIIEELKRDNANLHRWVKILKNLMRP